MREGQYRFLLYHLRAVCAEIAPDLLKKGWPHRVNKSRFAVISIHVGQAGKHETGNSHRLSLSVLILVLAANRSPDWQCLL